MFVALTLCGIDNGDDPHSFPVFFSNLFDGFVVQVLGVLEFTQQFIVIMIPNERDCHHHG